MSGPLQSHHTFEIQSAREKVATKISTPTTPCIASRRIIESCSVVFEENDGSQVAQFHVSDVDDLIPQEAIRRMGVGFFRPVEDTLVVDREGQCSTQVEPSSTQENP